MFELDHNVRVFVFQFMEAEIQYLLLRQKPKEEWPLGPVVGSVGVSEHMQDAIVREVEEETGYQRPHHIIDLSQTHKELFGDIGLVEWAYAYQAGTPEQPANAVSPGPTVGEFAWYGFQDAFQRLETARDQQALIRLQLSLEG